MNDPDAQLSVDPMFTWVQDLFPITRSLTGAGVRETLGYLKSLLPNLSVESVASGERAFDWTVPNEWSARAAYVEDSKGRRIVDFAKHNLHLVGYSVPFDGYVTREELEAHLYSLPDMPTAIPYVTSYYAPRWGFCMSHDARQAIEGDRFYVHIDTSLAPGVLNYGELLIQGDTSEEVLLSTYVCHPSMANNELSGPAVTTALARWIEGLPTRRYSYRIIFIPETIGSLVYLSRNLATLKERVVAGFVITCVGDDRAYSYLPSRLGGTLADRAALAALRDLEIEFRQYSFLDRGSDERQFCSPGADLPVCSLMRSKYGEYPEYHTSLDDLHLVTQDGLEGALRLYQRAILNLEQNATYNAGVVGEPQLGKRGLYPTLSTKSSGQQVATMMNLLAYADGRHDLLAIAETINASVEDCHETALKLAAHGLLDVVKRL